MRKIKHSKNTICFISGEVASALISAGASTASVGGGILTAENNRDYARQENEKARKWSEEQMEKQRKQELEDRAHEEQYNDPASQKLRMLAAGLSPEGSSSSIVQNAQAGTAESVGAQSPSEYNPNGIGHYIDPVQTGIGALTQIAALSNMNADTENKNADTDNKEVLTDKIKAETDAIKANTHFTELNAKSQEIINTYLDEQEQLAIDKTKQDMQYTEAQVENIKAGTAKIKQYMEEMFPAELKKIVAEEGLLSEKALSEAKNREYVDKLMEKCDAEIDLICEQTGLTRMDVTNYATNHMQSGFMGTGWSLVNSVKGLGTTLGNNAIGNLKAKKDQITASMLSDFEAKKNKITAALLGNSGNRALSKKTKDLHKVDEVKYTSDGRAYYPYRKKK